MDTDGVLAIGVDGGASGVRALAVRRRADGHLEAAGAVARRAHAPFDGRGSGVPETSLTPSIPDARELAAARERVSAAAEVIAEAADGRALVAVGVCWPGIKTPDGRGVAWMRHGPRDASLLDALEMQLAERGIRLARPMPPLASDGVAGALGERWAVHGLLHDVDDALYLAGGSGLAESVLVDRRVRALDEFDPPIRKAWQLAFEGDETFEDALAMDGWSRRAGTTVVDWVEALDRDPDRARDVFERASRALAQYVVDRMERLRESVDAVPVRAVIGARLGQYCAHARTGPLILGAAAAELSRAGFPRDFLRTSALLEAPAFGAAALALGLENEDCPS